MSNSLIDADSIAIVGLEKNTGKTTFLNYLIQQLAAKRRLALTSIGYDGESTDLVTRTAKPRIYVGQGTLVATARALLDRCQVEKEILHLSGIHSALGEIIIFSALDDGFIELAGPGSIGEMKQLKAMLHQIDSSAQLIVDGALSRLSSAGHGLCQEVVLCTGGAVHPDAQVVIDETVHTAELLQLPIVHLSEEQLDLMVSNDYIITGETTRAGCFPAPLDVSELLEDIRLDDTSLIIQGVITQEMMDELLSQPTIMNLDLIAQDPTRFFIDPSTWVKLKRRGIELKVRQRANLAAIIVNPTAPRGPSFGPDFQQRIQERVSVPVIDVRRYHGTFETGL